MSPAPDGSGAFSDEQYSGLAAVEPGNFWFESRNRLIVWALRRHFPGAQSFLEVGCGTGFVLQAISRACPSMTLAGSDVGDTGLAFARARVPGAAVYADDARSIHVDHPYDVVGAFDVIEHIDDDRAALRAMHDAIAPGGGLMLTVPQHAWLWGPADEYAHHFRRYARRDLLARVTTAGFEILRVTSFVSLLLPLMAALRFRDRRGGFKPMIAFRLPGVVHAAFSAVLTVERAGIRAGVSWPAGGSLLLVARRPR